MSHYQLKAKWYWYFSAVLLDQNSYRKADKVLSVDYCHGFAVEVCGSRTVSPRYHILDWKRGTELDSSSCRRGSQEHAPQDVFCQGDSRDDSSSDRLLFQDVAASGLINKIEFKWDGWLLHEFQRPLHYYQFLRDETLDILRHYHPRLLIICQHGNVSKAKSLRPMRGAEIG